MTLPRRAQISLASTPYYHVVARCVRRAFLCGSDAYTGKNFDHRKQWLLDRLATQSAVFAVDICAYAIMSNHYHLVVHIDTAKASGWSDNEVIDRWTMLFTGPILIQQFKAGNALSDAQLATVSEIAAVWRHRLSDISWYMRCLNEFIARRANAEDNCSGRFWEGRFKSQALLDQSALVACMAYVDLNPVRAGLATTLRESSFTSVQSRLAEEQGDIPPERDEHTKVPLLQFTSSALVDDTRLPLTWPAYLSLVEATGRQRVRHKRGSLSDPAAETLSRLGLSQSQWHALLYSTQRDNLSIVGSPEKLHAFQLATGRRRTGGTRLLRLIYKDSP